MKAAWEVNPELATVSLPDSYSLAAKKMTCGSCIRPRRLHWLSWCPPVSLAWLQKKPLSVPTWQRLATAVGVHGCKCQGACSTSWVTSSEGLYSGKADPRDHACSYPGVPHCECVRGSCFHNTILALPLNSDKVEYWSLWLPVPRMPKSRAYWSEGTRWRWDCVVLFSEKL